MSKEQPTFLKEAPYLPEGAAAAAESVLDDYERHINAGLARLYRFMGAGHVEWSAEGSLVWDETGKAYIDCSGGFAVLNLGHRHPRVVAAVEAQLQRMTASTRVFINPVAVELARKLAEVLPGELETSFLANSGTEAVEAALKIARLYTGKMEIIAARHAFHGKSLGSLAATDSPAFRESLLPLLRGVRHVPFGDTAAVEAAIGPETAAVLVEPIQGEAGVILPPDGYLKDLRKICDRKGVLLIFDEVQTGMGRTGRFLACEHEEVAPDIVTLAKGLGGGIIPIGAAVARREIMTRVFDESPLIHSSTMGGNPLAAAAAVAAIDATLEEDLPRRAAEKGAWFLARLQELQRRYPRVLKEVRGRGLLIGFEMAKPGAGGMFIAELLEQGVLPVPSLNNFAIGRLAPALNMPDAYFDRVLEVVETALERIQAVVDEL